MKVANIMAPVVGIAALAAPVAAAPQTFDLICHNVATISAAGIRPIETVEDKRMSVDLGRKLWCWHDGSGCGSKLPIKTMSDGHLKLLSIDVGAVAMHAEVDQASGTYSAVMDTRSGGTVTTQTTKGRCEMAPFTPQIL